MEPKNIEELLKHLNLSPEEFEQHKELIQECIQREKSLDGLNLEESGKKLSDAYQNLFGNIQSLYSELENGKNKLEQTIQTLEHTKEQLEQNNKDLKKLNNLVNYKFCEKILDRNYLENQIKKDKN